MFANQIGRDISNILPAVGVLVLILTKVLSTAEVVRVLTGDMVWMIAGMSVMSSVLGQTGVGDLIGQTVLKILGGNPSGMFVLVVFCVVTTILTNFLSNMGTMALMCPIAAATAQAGGMNVKACVLVCAISAGFALLLPIGSAGAMMGFGIGNHNPAKTMKFTLPLVILMMVTLIISANLLFPVYAG